MTKVEEVYQPMILTKNEAAKYLDQALDSKFAVDNAEDILENIKDIKTSPYTWFYSSHQKDTCKPVTKDFINNFKSNDVVVGGIFNTKHDLDAFYEFFDMKY